MKAGVGWGLLLVACGGGAVGDGAVAAEDAGAARAARSHHDGPYEDHDDPYDSDGHHGDHDGPLACGTVLHESTRLHHDIGPCVETDGLILGADAITLDCGGHTIRGWFALGARGVVADGVHRVTIRNCRLDRFLDDIFVKDSVGSRILDNEVQGHGSVHIGDTCIDLTDTVGVRVRGNALDDCFSLVDVRDSTVGTFEHNALTGGFAGMRFMGHNEQHRVRENHAEDVTGFFDAPAFLLMDEARGNRLDHNEVLRGGFGFTVRGDSAQGNLLEHNVVDGVHDDGFHLQDSDRNVVRYNRVTHAGENGFRLEGSATGNLIHRNEADGNGEHGFFAMDGADDNVLDHDSACGNGLFDAAQEAGATGNRWFDNHFCTTSGL
jgi:parallel beta-helix repeat protein